jgi:hypothetical protein
MKKVLLFVGSFGAAYLAYKLLPGHGDLTVFLVVQVEATVLGAEKKITDELRAAMSVDLLNGERG